MPGDHAAGRVPGGIGGRDFSGVDERLDQAVITRQPPQLLPAVQIGTAIAQMGYRSVRFAGQGGNEGGGGPPACR